VVAVVVKQNIPQLLEQVVMVVVELEIKLMHQGDTLQLLEVQILEAVVVAELLVILHLHLHKQPLVVQD
tara:strand:- start:108 stop:314 length:207 start_codon:yes stop_codon:yes gene_type:complete